MNVTSLFTKKPVIIGFGLITMIFVAVAFQRDLIYKNSYTGDLRNRVVGARLIYDGKLPYFYNWKVTDGTRYYDPSSFTGTGVSNRSASPMFHELVIPICNFPQAQITDIWFYLEYFSYLIIILISLLLAKNYKLKLLVWAASLAFLFTDAWKSHISAGQLYLFIPLLCSLFTYLFVKWKNTYSFLLCGFIAALLVLIRPNFIIFFLPFVLVLKQFKLKNIVALILPFLLFITWIFTDPFQHAIWKEYFSFVKESIYWHQRDGVNPATSGINTNVRYERWEGIVSQGLNETGPVNITLPHSENGNFFVIYNKLFPNRISTLALSITCCSLIILLLLFFYTVSRGSLSLSNHAYLIMIFGFCLYMLSDLFSPIYRHQYYTVQWFFTVLLFLGMPKKLFERKYVVLVLTGVFLNMINIPFLKMEHTLGEYLILFSLLLFSFTYFKTATPDA
jgi:hypothetical protein